MSGQCWTTYRDGAHRGATGRVLEIGAPTDVDYRRARFLAVIPARGEAVVAGGDSFEIADVRPDRLPYPAAAFDVVVCTLTLCCADSPDGVVGEISRVLRPGGHLRFLEHSRGMGVPVPGRRWRGQPGRDRCRAHSDPLALLLGGGLVIRRADIVAAGPVRGMPLVSGVAVQYQEEEAWQLGPILGRGNRSS